MLKKKRHIKKLHFQVIANITEEQFYKERCTFWEIWSHTFICNGTTPFSIIPNANNVLCQRSCLSRRAGSHLCSRSSTGGWLQWPPLNYSGQNMRPVDLYYRKAQKESKYESVQLLLFLWYYYNKRVYYSCVYNTSDYKQKPSVLHYQIESTLQYPELANTDGELTALWLMQS